MRLDPCFRGGDRMCLKARRNDSVIGIEQE